MAFKIKFKTQIFFGITLFFFVLTKNIFNIFFLIFDESMLINENLFPKSIKNTQKTKNKKQKTKNKNKNKKQNKTKSKFTTTMVNCHQQNYHHCHFPYQHYRYRHSTYIKYQLLCCRSKKKIRYHSHGFN